VCECDNDSKHNSVPRRAALADQGRGRMLISDLCINDFDALVRDELFQWSDCVGGALDEETYLGTITRAGFADVGIVDKQTFSAGVVKAFLEANTESTPVQQARRESLWPKVDNKVSSVRVHARKPEQA